MSEIYNGKNQEIKEIMNRYEHYEYMNYADYKAFNEYHAEVKSNLSDKNMLIKHTELTANDFKMVEDEFEEIDHIKNYKIYNSTLVTLMEMNGTVERVWQLDDSGYSNNPFFDFQKLVKQINCYYGIEEPYKPANKIAYGWKFCLEKGDKSCFYKGCRLYLWGCIKNYLKRNGIDFTKETSLQVRKIVGLADIYSSTE